MGIRNKESAWQLLDKNGDNEATLEEVVQSVENVRAPPLWERAGLLRLRRHAALVQASGLSEASSRGGLQLLALSGKATWRRERRASCGEPLKNEGVYGVCRSTTSARDSR